MYIQWFEHVGKGDIDLVGGKGANLGELFKHQIAVPQGFIVTTKGYERYIDYNHLKESIQETLEKTEGEGQLNAACDKVKKSIQEGDLPEDLSAEIYSGYGKLGEKARVAVRSSATAEDLAEASFAGQQETYLNVIGYEALVNRIKDCFASCFAYRAVAYRKEKGVPQESVKAAVVIQKMIEAEAAGVMFTANVLNGKRNETVINASYGLGEAVVSGMVTPDQYILNEEGKEISSYIGSKEIEIVYDHTETKEQLVSQSLRCQRVLTKPIVKRLFEEGQKIQSLYGKPMDIEWGVRQDEVYILQARPITTLKEKIDKAWQPAHQLSKKEKDILAFNLEHCPYAYYPLDFEIGMILAQTKEHLFKTFGLKIPSEFEMDENGFVTLGSGKMGINGKIIHLPKVFRQMHDSEKNKVEGLRSFNECEKALKHIEAVSFESLNEKQCAVLLEELKKLQEKIALFRFKYFIFPAYLYGKGFKKYLKKVGNVTEYNLLGQLKYKTWVVNEDLSQLASRLKQNKDFAVHMDGDWKALKKKFPSEWKLIEDFLGKHGYRSEFNCYPFSAASWNEEPERLLNLLKQMMSMPKKAKQKAMPYDELLDQMKKVAGKKADQLEVDIEYYRLCHVYRESSQYLWETCFALMRAMIRRLAQIWKLEEVKELWFLTYEELMNACENGFTQKEREQIQKRKQARPQVEDYWRQLASLIVEENKDSNVLQGVSGSSGTVSGKACLVRSKEEFSKLKKGDILVCPFTEPEWTPLFAMAAAVVSDTGGSLSHAAIVAREYGIPAVLGTGKATEVIKDGERICVEGNCGRVVLRSDTAIQ